MENCEIYRALCCQINPTPVGHKKRFYSKKVEECGKDQNKPFKLKENFMGSSTSVNLSHFTAAELLVD